MAFLYGQYKNGERLIIAMAHYTLTNWLERVKTGKVDLLEMELPPGWGVKSCCTVTQQHAQKLLDGFTRLAL